MNPTSTALKVLRKLAAAIAATAEEIEEAVAAGREVAEDVIAAVVMAAEGVAVMVAMVGAEAIATRDLLMVGETGVLARLFCTPLQNLEPRKTCGFCF